MNLRTLVIIVAAFVIVVATSTYTVDQRETAILFRLGEIKQAGIEPGLHFKLPFINNVRSFDRRILTLDSQPERYLTVEKKNVTVDFFVKWRIDDVRQYYRATRGLEQNADNRLSQIIKDGLRNEFGKRTIQEAVSGERQDIMGDLRVKANEVANELGIEVVDVRISRIELPEEVSNSVYDRMRAERARVAKEFRARGMETAERIRATADKTRTVILAEAYREAQSVRGEGDAKAANVYAKAYDRNREFYAFTRSLKAYTSTFDDENDVLVLEPDAEFFRYFNQASGGQK